MPIYHGYNFENFLHPRACKMCKFINCKCEAFLEAQRIIDECEEVPWPLDDDLGESPTDTRTELMSDRGF